RVACIVVHPKIRFPSDIQPMIGGVPSRGREVAGRPQRLPRVDLKHSVTTRQAENRRSDRSRAAFAREDVKSIVRLVVGHALEVVGTGCSGTRTATEPMRGSECLFLYHPFESPGPWRYFEDR